LTGGKKRIAGFGPVSPLIRTAAAAAVVIMSAYFDRLRIDVFVLLAVYAVLGFLLAVKSKWRKRAPGSRHLVTIFDLIFVTALVLVTGGSASFCWPLYLVAVIAASFGRAGFTGAVTALLSAVFYSAAIYYSEKTVKNVPADFLAALALVALTTFILARKGKETTMKLAKTDAMTGAFNFSYFQECIDWAVRSFEISGRPVSLLFIDVDDFKAINDTYGHQRGDETLKVVGRAIMSAVRKNDMVFRYGGDEFAVILQTDSEKEAFLVAERIRENVRRLADGLTAFKKVSVSTGIAVLNKNCASKALFLEAADRALYESKRQGKNRIAVYPGSAGGK